MSVLVFPVSHQLPEHSVSAGLCLDSASRFSNVLTDIGAVGLWVLQSFALINPLYGSTSVYLVFLGEPVQITGAALLYCFHGRGRCGVLCWRGVNRQLGTKIK